MDSLAIFNLPEHAHHWIERGGYLALFSLLFACGLGLPLPEDFPLIFAGVLIAKGQMHWAIAAPLAWLGIIGGDCVLYTLGWKWGYDIVHLPMVGRHISAARIRRAEKLFDRFGVFVVGVGRMFAGIRGAMVVAAGTTRFKFVKFIIADGLGAVLSGGLFMWAGFFFGSMRRLHEVRRIVLIAGAIGGIALMAYIWWRLRREEPEDPGLEQRGFDVVTDKASPPAPDAGPAPVARPKPLGQRP